MQAQCAAFCSETFHELQSHIPCLDTVTMSVIFPRAERWSVTLRAPGRIHETTFAPPENSDETLLCCIEPFTPPALCLTYPFSPFIRYSSLFLLILSKHGASFIFHHLPPTVCRCLSVMSGCLFSPPLCHHSLLLILTPFFVFKIRQMILTVLINCV